MAQQRLENDSDPADSAIQRVLEAERVGEQMLVECRQRAQLQVAAARQKAEAIARRADARISKLHVSHQQKIDRELAALGRPGEPAADLATAPWAIAALAQAAKRIAARLTGGQDEPAG